LKRPEGTRKIAKLKREEDGGRGFAVHLRRGKELKRRPREGLKAANAEQRPVDTFFRRKYGRVRSVRKRVWEEADV